MKIYKVKNEKEALQKLYEVITEIADDNDGKISIVTPQFERQYDITIPFVPHDKNELQGVIETAPKDVLKKMGVGIWSTWKEDDEETDYMSKGDIHYLFPVEWYDHIPEGFEIISLFGEKEKFEHGKTDDDIRYGCLPYGFIRKY